MTKIILVRHGHVEGISPERFRGRADLALTPEGRRQAEATARRIEASWTPTALYASPLSRSLTTAEAIGRPFGLAPTPLPGLMDIDYGEWQGLTADEVGHKWPEALDTWQHAPHWAAIPGGESLQDVLTPRGRGAARGDRAASERYGRAGRARQRHRIILLHALELPLSRYRRLGQDPCAINEIDFTAGELTVRSVNGTYHLRGLSSKEQR